LAALRNLGWKSADFRKLYSDPPESTEQILHPEKYATLRDRPTRVEVDLPKGVQRPWTNTAGELHYRQMLAQRLTAATAERAAAGWGGDLTSLEQHRVGSKSVPVVTAVTVWDTEADAREFDEALRAAHAARGADAPALASQLDGKQVRHVAKLARLAITPDEESKLVTQLSLILDAVDTLAEVNTEGVPPTTFAVTDAHTLTRPDEARDELRVEEALQNAPQKHGDSFVIPRVIE
jgi:aspartyl-tRNA(Asn)/glutamyl-tRNA(Gln) amidotransferase subunit C